VFRKLNILEREGVNFKRVCLISVLLITVLINKLCISTEVHKKIFFCSYTIIKAAVKGRSCNFKKIITAALTANRLYALSETRKRIDMNYK